jgi:uncharacterized protein YoxC
MEKAKTEECEEKQKEQPDETKVAIITLEELGKEIEGLGEEKTNLLEIEKKLQGEIEKETKRREKKRDRLKTEVDGLKKKCEELAVFVNNLRDETPAEK